MDNKYVDTLIIISCLTGFVIGLFMSNYGILIYNIIFFLLIMTIILLLVIKLS